MVSEQRRARGCGEDVSLAQDILTNLVPAIDLMAKAGAAQPLSKQDISAAVEALGQTLKTLASALDEISARVETFDTLPALTPDQSAALAGTSGMPGSTNKFVTNNDSRNTNARTPTAHTHVFADVSTNGIKIHGGSGDPENVVTGAVGDLFLRTNVGTGTTLYVKESGTGNTGWKGK